MSEPQWVHTNKPEVWHNPIPILPAQVLAMLDDGKVREVAHCADCTYGVQRTWTLDEWYARNKPTPEPRATAADARLEELVQATAEKLAETIGATDERIEDLVAWWLSLTVADIQRTVPKTMQYGSHDLEVMAEAFKPLLPTVAGETDAQKQARAFEAAVWFYTLGKVARVQSSLINGHDSDDHWFDMRIYTIIQTHLSNLGRWP